MALTWGQRCCHSEVLLLLSPMGPFPLRVCYDWVIPWVCQPHRARAQQLGAQRDLRSAGLRQLHTQRCGAAVCAQHCRVGSAPLMRGLLRFGIHCCALGLGKPQQNPKGAVTEWGAVSVLQQCGAQRHRSVPSGLSVLLGAPSLTPPVENSPALLSSSFFPSAVFQIRKGKLRRGVSSPTARAALMKWLRSGEFDLFLKRAPRCLYPPSHSTAPSLRSHHPTPMAGPCPERPPQCFGVRDAPAQQ